MDAEELELEKKLNKAQLELEELKQRRTEDAKANEKVVAIFAAHEQRWIAERKTLRLQIQALVHELQSAKSTHEEATSAMEKRLKEEEAKRVKELEQQRSLAEQVADEAAERAKKAAQDHAAELWKHKTAFVELFSSQRKMEAEIGRALLQAEAARREAEEVAESREEALSVVDKMHKDSKQKDRILSAMLRKSKLDAAERLVLLREVKMAKAQKKQVELEEERWRSLWESSSRRKKKDATESSHKKSLDPSLECFQLAESRSEEEASTTAIQCYDRYSMDEDHDKAGKAMDDYQQLQDWVRKEAEKLTTILEQKNYAEMEAFTEKVRFKDEKFETFRWRLLSMELEAKRHKSHIEGLNRSLSQMREDNTKLEAMLLDKEKEIKSLKDQQLSSLNTDISDPADSPSPIKSSQEPCEDQLSTTLISNSVEEEIMEKVVSSDVVNSQESISIRKDTSWKMDIQTLGVSYKIKRLKQQLVFLEKLAASPAMKQMPKSTDASTPAVEESSDGSRQQQTKDLLVLKSLLTKQLKRYQSLEEKTGELCRRMHENYRSGSRTDLQNGRTKDQTDMLQRFLEETFQLQRIVVATGQKLMEVQRRIGSSFHGDIRVDECGGFNMGQFVDVARSLLREIQRGLEVRIARIIGDLEGTLACDGILHS